MFSLRGPAWRRGAAGLVAVVGCGFFAQTALAGPPPAPASAPLASASTFDGQIPTADPAAGTDQSAGPAVDTASADIPAADPLATALTAQSAGSTATATQQQPVNVVVIVRVDSPGNDGPITQQNIAVAPSIAANDASTAQSGGDGAAATSQQATATATATQDGAGNYVITVRTGSPGANGAVSQANGVVGASSGSNTSDTDQQVAAPKPAVQPQARRAGAARSPQHSREGRQPTAMAPTSAESRVPQDVTADVDSAGSAPGPVGIRRVHRNPDVLQESRGHTRHEPTLSSIARGTIQALSPILPQARPAADAAGPADVSRPVLLTLLMLIAAGAAAVLLRRAVVPRRAASRRPPR